MKFREGKIIDRFFVRKNGKDIEIILRYPKKSDVKGVWKFYNKVIKETEFLSRMAFVPLKEEKKWVGKVIEGLREGNKIQIFAENNKKIIGSSSVERKLDQRHVHVGGFGICILQKFAGMGIGKRMMINIEKEARKTNFKILELSVYGRNKIAQNLYKSMGFKVVGRIPKSVKIRNGYDDDVIMYKVLKK